ncbi:hypothetical protein CBR_g23311 [Chara braunii]|uniref:Uncharacterized protein n=1 Tax=Chara braunii TaxID=69332 RepID=A0A388L3V0_CHABU|nr:hypothetical protein CBR_g23311 [Chara braunii]|eukprot:GBG76980.1 hypothetical protein CBR_g23311 [Chara braunii]
MSFFTERALGDHLLTPRCYISAIRQVHHPRLSPDLRRLAQFFCAEGVYVAPEFRFAGSPRAVVLAEAVAVHRRSAPEISHVSTVVAFSGDISVENGIEGDLLGFLFGSVRPDHRQLIVQELTVPLAQLTDDLPLEIVSQSDNSPVPLVLTRTLAPYLQWSACLEEPGSGHNPPSQRGYLSLYEIVDLAFFQDRTASENEEVEIEAEEESSEEEEEAEEEGAKEETPEEGSSSEHNEGEQSEEEEEEEEQDDQEELKESEWEGFEEEVCAEELERTEAEQAEDPEAARKREEIAAGKRQLEFASAAGPRTLDDPRRDPEPPKPEHGDPAAETSVAPARPRRSRSPSPSTTDRPPIRPRTDGGHRASSPVIIPPSP